MQAQGKFALKNGMKNDKIQFKLINNLIVFSVIVNDVELSFLLDSGVSKPVIFNVLNEGDSLEIKNTESVFVRGLGGGLPIKALRSKNNKFEIGQAINYNQDLYVILDSSLDFAPRLGIPIHGIIGYDLFKEFIVEINYVSQYIKLHDPKLYKKKSCRKCEIFNLEFHKNKPYLNAKLENRKLESKIKLLIDSGGSDALWLFEDSKKGVYPPEKYYTDFLGNGLSGTIHGKRAIVDKLMLKSFTLKNINVAFPDSSSIAYARKLKSRNGSISGKLLKRFNHIVDYNGKTWTMKKNRFFSKPFPYDKSGISLEYGDVRLVTEKENKFNDGRNYTSGNKTSGNVPIIVVTTYKYSFKPAFTIVQLREGSPAYNAGLLIEDVILKVNGEFTHAYSLQEMNSIFTIVMLPRL